MNGIKVDASIQHWNENVGKSGNSLILKYIHYIFMPFSSKEDEVSQPFI